MTRITDAAALRSAYGAIHPLAAVKVMPRLDNHACAFIRLSPFLVLATADGEGRADASPRGDPPGFVLILDDATLLLPDRPGNNRLDSYGNILRHPGIGLMFFVPGIDETLRVNGRAYVVTDADLMAQGEVAGRIPRAGLAVTVEEVFFHCGKALKRSHLWDDSRHVSRQAFPSLGTIIADQTRAIEAADADHHIEDNYRTGLY